MISEKMKEENFAKSKLRCPAHPVSALAPHPVARVAPSNVSVSCAPRGGGIKFF